MRRWREIALSIKCFREQRKPGLQHAGGAKFFRCVGKDFRPALSAKSEYARHCRRADRALPLVLREILSQVTPVTQKPDIAAHLRYRWALQPCGQSRLAITIDNAGEIDGTLA